ncbi:MAG: hypothetical protein IRZ33_06230 [Alicyclobacillaceae bacterium]|nr:hypothetical protein [Alicyclobacillaceae bacterium]
MRISPLGSLVVAVGACAGIAIWVIGYYTLPNADTHRNLKANPPVAASATESATPNTTTSGGTSGAGAGGQSGTGGQAAATNWYSLGKTPKTLNLDITAAATSDASGFNFNGYNNGQLKITVPLGWKINVTFANKDPNIPHSVGFVPYAQRNQMQGTAAFPGSLGPKFVQGITASAQPQHFSFVANKPGKYAMICGVPGHDEGGMWDEFDVDKAAKAPTITTPSGTVTVK